MKERYRALVVPMENGEPVREKVIYAYRWAFSGDHADVLFARAYPYPRYVIAGVEIDNPKVSQGDDRLLNPWLSALLVASAVFVIWGGIKLSEKN